MNDSFIDQLIDETKELIEHEGEPAFFVANLMFYMGDGIYENRIIQIENASFSEDRGRVVKMMRDLADVMEKGEM